MTDEQFNKLIEILNNVGSQVYAAALDGVAAGAAVAWVAAIVFGVLFVCAVVLFIKAWKYELPETCAAFFFGALLAAIATLVTGGHAYSLTVAPEWAAIEYLANLVK